MHMPEEISRLIQAWARPRTRPDWREGSYMHRTVGYADLYWEVGVGRGPTWYYFWHAECEVRLAYFLHGWRKRYVSGVHLLQRLYVEHTPFSFIKELFLRMTTENLFQLAIEVRVLDPRISHAATRMQLFEWIFEM